jgi:surface antigen
MDSIKNGFTYGLVDAFGTHKKQKLLVSASVVFLISILFVSCAAAADSARFVKDVTIPDRSVVDAGTTFTKTWAFTNTGTVTWTGYTLKLVSPPSDVNFYPASVSIPTTKPGQQVSISVTLTAPNPAHAAQESTWQIRNSAGVAISGGTATLKVTINPKQGTNIPNLKNSGYLAPTNLYAVSGYGGQCTAFAWGRAYEKTGIKLKFINNNYPNANVWYDQTTSPKGQIPMPNSIVVWTSGTYGHVAYLESLNGNNIILNQANKNSYKNPLIYPWGGGYDGAPLTTLTRTSIGSYMAGLKGYIYLTDVPLSISPASGPRGTTFTFSGKGYTPNGKITWHVKNPNGVDSISTQPIDSSGNLRVIYPSKSTDIKGVYTVWAVDNRGTSNEIKETIT